VNRGHCRGREADHLERLDQRSVRGGMKSKACDLMIPRAGRLTRGSVCSASDTCVRPRSIHTHTERVGQPSQPVRSMRLKRSPRRALPCGHCGGWRMKPADRHEITSLFRDAGQHGQGVVDAVVPLLYEELKAVAHFRLGQLRPGGTVNTTGLVHDAYLRLAASNEARWNNRGHFLAVASKTMRRILLNYARDRVAEKRGGGAHRVSLDASEPAIAERHAEALIEMNDLIERFQEAHPRPAAALAHRYFGGLQNAEIAEAMDVSVKTVERDLRFGRAWITRQWARDPQAWPVE